MSNYQIEVVETARGTMDIQLFSNEAQTIVTHYELTPNGYENAIQAGIIDELIQHFDIDDRSYIEALAAFDSYLLGL